MKIWTHGYVRASKKAHQVLAETQPEAVKSIAVIKHAALGDMVLTRPFLTTLRKHFPNAKITLSVVENYMNGLPEDLVDRVHVAAGKFRPRPSFLKRWRSFRALGYHDLLFDISATPDSFWITWLNPARLKVGFEHRFQGRLLYDVSLPRSFMKFESESFLDLLGILRLAYDWPLDFGYPPAPAYEGKPYLLYFPTASENFRTWQPERFGELIRHLAGDLPDYEHRLLYGVRDWEMAVGDAIMNMAGDTPGVVPLKEVKGDEFQALVRNATALISTDTGVRNLAIAFGTPTVGILPVSLVYTYLPRFGHHAAVFNHEGESPQVPEVREAARKLIAEIEQTRRG